MKSADKNVKESSIVEDEERIMSSMKVLKKLSQSFLSMTLSFTLIFPFGLYAQDENETKPRKNRGAGFSNAMDTVGSLAGAATSAIQNAQNREAAQRLVEQTKLALTPTQFENEYFPGCATLPAMMPETVGLCEAPPSNVQEAYAYQEFRKMIATNRSLYTQYGKEQGNKKFANHGIPCVNGRIDEANDLLTQREVSLTEMLARMNESKEAFDRKLKPQQDAIKELHGYLHGGNGNESNNTRKYSNLFRQVANDRNCGSFMDSLQVQNHAKKGLKNIESEVNKIRTGSGGEDLVTHLLRNQGNIQSSIRTYANNVSRNISKKGLESSIEKLGKGNMGISVGMGLDGSKAISSLLQKQSNFFDEEISDMKRSFDNLDQSDLAESIFKEGSHNFNKKIERWRNKKQNECLSRKISLKSSNPYQAFVSRIEHTDSKIRSKSNIASIQTEVKNHLNNKNLSVEEKLKLVKKAISSKGSQKLKIMSYDTHDGTSIQKGWDPAELLGSYVSSCLDEYTRIEVNGEGNSLKSIESEARKIHTKYKQLETQFPQKVSAAIYDKMINCKQDGQVIPYSVSSKSCDSKKLSLDNENFCLGQSVKCAQNINSCSQKIEETIVNVTANLQNVATNINASVLEFLNYQRQTIASLKQQALGQSKQLEQLFAKSKFFIPIDMTIADPEKQFKMDGIGKALDVAVYNPEDIMKDFTAKVENLIQQVSEQKQAILAEMDKEKSAIQSNYSEEQARWATLEQQCAQGVAAYNQAENERVAALNEQNGKDQQAMAGFCKAFGRYKRAPGCDEQLEDLDKSMDGIAHLIDTGEVVDMFGRVESNCLKFSANDKSKGEYTPPDATKKEMCAVITCTDQSERDIKLKYDEHMAINNNAGRSLASAMEKNEKVVKYTSVPACESISNMGTGFDNIASSLTNALNTQWTARE